MSVVALSMRQPWLFAVLELGKRIENRVWNTKHRGRFLLHASKLRNMRNEERYYEGAVRWMLDHGVIRFAHQIPPIEMFGRGGFMGSATLLDVVKPVSRGEFAFEPTYPAYPRDLDRRWHMVNQYGFILERVEKLQLGVEYPGALQFFPVPDNIVRQTGAFAL